MTTKYSFYRGDWHDAEEACGLREFSAIENYDAFPSLDYVTWMARFRNGRLAAIVLAFPGVLLLLEEHPKADGAARALIEHVNQTDPIRLWYNARGDEERIAGEMGYVRAPWFEDSIYITPDVSEIEAHRLLRRYELAS